MQTKFKIKILFITVVLFNAVLFDSCKKFVDVGSPAYQVTAANVYTNDATAIAVMTGLYTNLSYGNPGPEFVSGTQSLSLRSGLSADEFTLFGGANTTFIAFYQNALVSNPTMEVGADYWNVLYNHIFYVNSAIEGYTNSVALTPSVKQQLLGEAKFMRAFFYFYLVNLYGNVPLITTTDYKANASMARTATADVYKQIITDLKDAQTLLSSNYLDGSLQNYITTAERVRPTKWAATALLARVYLYIKDYQIAEQQATAVINQNSLFSLSALNNVFLKNSSEAIWQLQVVYSSGYTDDADAFNITTGFSNSHPVSISDTLLKSFEPNDARNIDGNWIKSIIISGNTYYYPYKYKNHTGGLTEYVMMLRLAEIYLIRAEARTQQNNLSGAATDLNVIRTRANLPNTTATTQSQLLTAIFHERQVEFFSEWGHRWFDLKRTGNVDAVMTGIAPLKGGIWTTTDQLYPLPISDILADPSLIQNPGY